MEEYPEELRTPPMPLVALVGLPELHSTISAFLHTEPLPINTLALPDFTKIAVVSGKERKPPDARLPPPLGILKIDWLWKHRSRVPAAIVLLLSREEVNGDPAQWMQVCTNLDSIKNVIRGRNIRLVVVVVQPSVLSGDVIEERLLALRKRAEVDSKYFLTYISQDLSEQKRSLARLGSVLAESVSIFYKEEGRRIKLRLEKKTFNSHELNARYNFKIAVYAEFRRDWAEALRFYETAYTLLQESQVVTAPIESLSVQRLVELKTVAEQLHFKVSTLLLHGGKEAEAVRWFRQHINIYKCLTGPPEGHFLHWSWVSKQFLVFGDLMQNSLRVATPSKPTPPSLGDSPVTDWELQSGYYYQVAAHYMLERCYSFRSSTGMFDAFASESMVDVLDGPLGEVGPPLYVGQSFRLLSRGTSFDAQGPTDREYLYHALIKEKMFPHSAATIDLLKKAYEQYKLIQAGRMVYYVASEMGREYYNAREYANAKQLLDSVANMYRQEAWIMLLWTTLGYLRECARQLQLLKEYIEYSLEMASLPTFPDQDGGDFEYQGNFKCNIGPAGPLCHAQREQVFKDLFELLQGKQSVLPAREGDAGLTVSESDPVALSIDVASPLRAMLQVCVAFHEQSVKPGMTTTLTLSLLTHLPLALQIQELEVHFNQSACNVILHGGINNLNDVTQATSTYDLLLQPNRWTRFSIDVVPGQSGKLECLTVTVRLGNSWMVSCQVESPASRNETSIWKFESGLEMLPMTDSSLSCFGQKAIQVEEPDPLVDLALEALGPGLLGEFFPVSLTIKSRGYSVYGGELKLSIAEASTVSLLSPSTPNASESSVVDLFTRTLTPEEDDLEGTNFQKFSGSVSVPSLTEENSWSIVVFLKWKEAKTISLFVSFSYQSEIIADGGIHPLRLFVHKGLQLECEKPLNITNKYMSPFSREALLLGGLDKGRLTGKACLPLNETSTLILTLQNSSSVQLELLSVTMNEAGEGCFVIEETNHPYDDTHLTSQGDCSRHLAMQSGESPGVVIMPGESFAKLFFLRPMKANPSLAVGTVSVRWRRLRTKINRNISLWTSDSDVSKCKAVHLFAAPLIVNELTTLPVVQVEKPPILVTFHCPPHGILGVPFSVSMCLENYTPLIQEVSYSIVDSPGFILSGAHSDTIHVLPYSKDVISCKLISIASGQQQLPQFNLTATRYNAGFQQSLANIQLFIFPSSSSHSKNPAAPSDYKPASPSKAVILHE